MRASDALLNELDMDGTFIAAKPSAEEQKRLEENRRRRDAQSQQMSELLLKGWTMLGEHCPVTNEVPLMQQPKTGRKFSVAVNKFVDELEAEDPAATSTALASPPASPSAGSLESSARALSSTPRAAPSPGSIDLLGGGAPLAPCLPTVSAVAQDGSPSTPTSAAPPHSANRSSTSILASARSGSGSARAVRCTVAQQPATTVVPPPPAAPAAPSSLGATAASDVAGQVDEGLDAAIGEVCTALDSYRLRLREALTPADARDTLQLIGACADALAQLRAARTA